MRSVHEIYCELIIKTPERRHLRQIVLMFARYFGVSIVDFEQVNASRVYTERTGELFKCNIQVVLVINKTNWANEDRTMCTNLSFYKA